MPNLLDPMVAYTVDHLGEDLARVFLFDSSFHYFLLLIVFLYSLSYKIVPFRFSQERSEFRHVVVWSLLFLSAYTFSQISTFQAYFSFDTVWFLLKVCIAIVLTSVIVGTRNMDFERVGKYNFLQLFKYENRRRIAIGSLVLMFVPFISQSKNDGAQFSLLTAFQFAWTLFYLLIATNYVVSLRELIAVSKANTSRQKREPDTNSNNSTKNIMYFSLLMTCVALTLIVLKVDLLHIGIFSIVIGGGIAVAFREFFHNILSGLILKWDASLQEKQTIRWGEGRTATIKLFTLRYTLLHDRNGIEILIPNSVLLSGPIINFSKSDKAVRITGVKVPIPHNSNHGKIMKTLERTATEVRRVKNYGSKVPKAFLVEHNSYATVIEIRFWIEDPEKGIANIKSDVLSACTSAVYNFPLDKEWNEGLKTDIPNQLKLLRET